jgi:hypothetical protein
VNGPAGEIFPPRVFQPSILPHHRCDCGAAPFVVGGIPIPFLGIGLVSLLANGFDDPLDGNASAQTEEAPQSPSAPKAIRAAIIVS